MADANREAEQLAALLKKANEELAAFGEVTETTRDKIKDSEMKAKYGIDNFTKSTATAASALGEVAKAGISTFKSMAEGKKGAAAFNEGLDHMAKSAELAAVALTLLIPGGPLIKGLVAGVTAVTVAVIQARAEFQKMSATMADKLYKSYSDLAKSGAAASTGMTGVLKLSKQLSLNMDELSDLTGIVAGNSQELALMGKSAAQGVQRLGDMGEAMKGSRKEFLAMGMSVTDVVEGQARYLKEMSRTGRAQNMTNKELADSAREYILQQNRLAELTGMSAKQQQEVLDRAKSHEMFNAKIRALELQNTDESRAAADELKKGLIMAAAIGPQMEAGYKAMVTGNLRSADAQKLNFTTAGQAQREILGVANGTRKATQAFDGITKATARHERTIGIAMSQLDAGSNVQLSSAEMERAAILSNMSYEERMRYIEEEEAKKRKASNDKLLKGQVDVIDRQIEANQAINAIVAEGIPKAQQGMIDVAEASVKAAKALARLAGVYKEEPPPKPVANQMSSVGRDYKMTEKEAANAREALTDPGVSERDKAWLRQQLQNIEKRAGGGPVDSSVPYLVGEKGPELFVPDTGGQIVPLDMAGNVSEYTQRSAENIKRSVEDILKDYKVQEKTIDKQTNNLQKFSRVEEQYFNKLTEFMNDVITEADQNGMPGVGQSFKPQSSGAQGMGSLMSAVQKAVGGMGSMPGMSGGGQASKYSLASGMQSGMGLKASGGQSMGSSQPMAGSEGAESTSSGYGINPNAASGMGLKDPKEQIKNAGLKIRPYGDVYQGGPLTDSALNAARTIQDTVKNFGMFTGLNDQYHKDKHPNSKHATGRGIDFVLGSMPTPEEAQEIKKQLQQISGVSLVMNEYFKPPLGDMNQHTTGPHFHVQTSAEEGGVFDGPNAGYPATLHGNEAVVPLQNNAGNFVKIFEEMASDSKNMLSIMQEMLRAQKDSVSAANKMLRMQS